MGARQSFKSTAFATAAQQETAALANAAVSPATQQRHPSACKAWGCVTGGGSPVLSAGYNVASIDDTGTGILTVNFSVPFSSTNYVVLANAVNQGGVTVACTSKSVGSMELTCRGTLITLLATDPSVGWDFACFGDQ